MKYIRVYEGDYVEDEYLTTYQAHCEHVANIQDNGFDFEGCIIKEADTIKELIDAYIIKDKDERLPFVSKTDFDYANNKDKNNFEVYGAIWVFDSNDVPTLKPVAKMNDKGELELL